MKKLYILLLIVSASTFLFGCSSEREKSSTAYSKISDKLKANADKGGPYEAMLYLAELYKKGATEKEMYLYIDKASKDKRYLGEIYYILEQVNIKNRRLAHNYFLLSVRNGFPQSIIEAFETGDYPCLMAIKLSCEVCSSVGTYSDYKLESPEIIAAEIRRSVVSEPIPQDRIPSFLIADMK